ncbi:family 20 glycosylhydrolase [bacterium]|nr:family 20 glycosylhydrolase [bacterium]
MKRLINVIMTLAVCTTVLAQIPVPALMPVPAEVEYFDGRYVIDADFTVGIEGSMGRRLRNAAHRFLRRLDERTALFLNHNTVAECSFSLKINTRREGALKLGEDESYQLLIDDESISLIAETDLGAMFGLETLLQLLSADSEGYYFPGVKIVDAPRFPWRGLMIDAARHWMPVEVIRRNLDAMAAVKMNVMHWHLSEDQGFRVECKTFPRLHELGSDGLYYTQIEIKDIIAYASDRGIRIVPEFDMPGHAQSWLCGYPELASAPGHYEIERRWGIMDPVMDPTRESTYKFLSAFINEMTSLFPDEYFHIGGDENNGKHWNANEDIQSFMKANNIPDNSALQAEFNRRILSTLTDNGKKMIGWDEILHESMPKDIVIHSWRGREAMEESARQGYQTILSNGYYIDLMQKTSFYYLNDPCPEDTPLSIDERRRILGGEATMWSEYVNYETVDSRIWPRTAAIAERFWSPLTVKDVPDMYSRLAVISLQLEEHGLTHIKNRSMMLRRLCRTADIHPMLVFLGTVEPVEVYQRGAQKQHFQYSPLSRPVDIALAEAVEANAFRHWVKGIMEHDHDGVSQFEAMRRQLTTWQQNHLHILEMANTAPALKEIVPLSKALADISGVAMQALKTLSEHGERRDAAWITAATQLLDSARVPYGQLELQIVDSVKKLVDAASN